MRERLTRAKAIRAKCIDCMGSDKSEVRKCTAVKCPLFPFRMGKEDTTLYEKNKWMKIVTKKSIEKRNKFDFNFD